MLELVMMGEVIAFDTKVAAGVVMVEKLGTAGEPLAADEF